MNIEHWTVSTGLRLTVMMVWDWHQTTARLACLWGQQLTSSLRLISMSRLEQLAKCIIIHYYIIQIQPILGLPWIRPFGGTTSSLSYSAHQIQPILGLPLRRPFGGTTSSLSYSAHLAAWTIWWFTGTDQNTIYTFCISTFLGWVVLVSLQQAVY